MEPLRKVTSAACLLLATLFGGMVANGLTSGLASAEGNRIADGEVYLDADPGIGLGLPLNIADGGGLDGAVATLLARVDLIGVEPGRHTVFLRLRDSSGSWTPPFALPLRIPEQLSALANRIARAELFFDTDPGEGQGLAVDLPEDGSLDGALEILRGTADLTTLEPGQHTAYLRVRDSAGAWTPAVGLPLFVPWDVARVGGDNVIVAADYALAPPDADAFGAAAAEDGAYGQVVEGAAAIRPDPGGNYAQRWRFIDSAGRVGSVGVDAAGLWTDREPASPQDSRDSDWDGLADSWEQHWFGPANLTQDGAADPDLDGIDNWEELRRGFDPLHPDRFSHHISGVVAEGDAGLAAVEVCLDSGSTPVCTLSDANGGYRFDKVADGAYTLSAAWESAFPAYQFQPAQRQVEIRADLDRADFLAYRPPLPPFPGLVGHLLGDPDRNGPATPAIGFGVNSVGGNWFYQTTDLSLPGKDLPFSFSRSYNSQDDGLDAFGKPRAMPLGPGWTHSYNLQLRFADDHSAAELVWGDGRRDGFVLQDGRWRAATPGNFAELSTGGGGGSAWEIRDIGQMRYRFDAGGRLLAIVSRSGHLVELAYDAVGRLAHVTDTAGRVIDFSYDEQGLLSAVSLPSAGVEDRIGFSYGGDGMLDAMTDRRGNLFRYLNIPSDHGLRLHRVYRANAPVAGIARVELETRYDDQGRVEEQQTGHTLTADGTGVYRYQWSDGGMSYRTPTGRGADFVWDAQQRVTRISRVNSLGAEPQTIGYNPDADGPGLILPVRIGDGEGAVIGLQFSGPDLQRIDAPADVGGTTLMAYSPQHELLSLDTPSGLAVSIEREPFGPPARLTVAAGSGIPSPIGVQFEYFGTAGLEGLPKRVEQADTGVVTEVIAYSDDGQPLTLRRTVAPGVTLDSDYAYDERGRRIRVRDHRGTLSCYYYDPNDNLLARVKGLTDVCPATLEATPPASASIRHTRLAYDADNRLVERIDGFGSGAAQRTTYAYSDNAGVLIQVCSHGDGKQRCVDRTYDRDLQVFESHYPSGREDRSYRLQDGRLRVTAESRSSGGVFDRIERRLYDDNDRLSAVDSCTEVENNGNDPVADCIDHQQRLVIERDGSGRPVKVREAVVPGDLTAATARTTQLSYADGGRRVTVTHLADPDQRETEYRYDALGQLIGVTETDSSGRQLTTVADYDASGRLVRVSDPQGLETHYRYDGLDRMLEQTDLRGTVRWHYDDAAGTTTRTEPDGSTVTTRYDRLGQRLSVSSSDGLRFDFGYDPVGRLISEAWSGGAGGSEGSRSLHYNGFGDLVQVDGPFTQSIRYRHDPAGRTERKEFPGGPIDYVYNGLDQITDMATPAGDFAFEYQNYTQALQSIVFPNGITSNYQRNGLGELIGLTASAPAGTPDSGNFLDYAIELDRLGRRTHIDAEQPTVPALVAEDLSLGYAADGQLATLNGAAVEHDPRGNLSNLPAPYQQSLVYDGLNRLQQVGDTRHDYDSQRNRVSTRRNGRETRYLLDLEGALPDLIGSSDADDQVDQTFIHGPGGLLAAIQDGRTRFIHQDFNHNVVALSDPSGAITDSRAYSPFGQWAGGNSSARTLPFGFAGGVGAISDPEGLIYMRARYYHPGIRQFTSPDLVPGVLGRPQSLGRYAYVEGMALGGVDPSGLFLDDIADFMLRHNSNHIRAQGALRRQKILSKALENGPVSDRKRELLSREARLAVWEATAFSKKAVLDAEMGYETSKLVKEQSEIAFAGFSTVATLGASGATAASVAYAKKLAAVHLYQQYADCGVNLAVRPLGGIAEDSLAKTLVGCAFIGINQKVAGAIGAARGSSKVVENIVGGLLGLGEDVVNIGIETFSWKPGKPPRQSPPYSVFCNLITNPGLSSLCKK